MSENAEVILKRKAFVGKIPEVTAQVPKGRWGPGEERDKPQ